MHLRFFSSRTVPAAPSSRTLLVRAQRFSSLGIIQTYSQNSLLRGAIQKPFGCNRHWSTCCCSPSHTLQQSQHLRSSSDLPTPPKGKVERKKCMMTSFPVTPPLEVSEMTLLINWQKKANRHKGSEETRQCS